MATPHHVCKRETTSSGAQNKLPPSKVGSLFKISMSLMSTIKVVPDASTVDASPGNREASFSGTLELGMHCVASSQAQTPPVWM